MTISTSIPKSSGCPSTSMTRPTGWSVVVAVVQHFGVDDHAVEFAGIGDLDRFGADAVVMVGGSRESPCLRGISIQSRSRSSMGNDPQAAARDAELAHHGGMGAPQDLDGSRLQCGRRVPGTGDADDGAVAVHGAADGIAAEVDVALTCREPGGRESGSRSRRDGR